MEHALHRDHLEVEAALVDVQRGPQGGGARPAEGLPRDGQLRRPRREALAALVQRRPSNLLRAFEREQRTRKPPDSRTKSVDSDIANPDKIELRELV